MSAKLASILFAAALALGAATPSKEIRKTVPIEPAGRVSIDNYKGVVEVTAWDNPQVEIYARVEPDAALFGTAREKECVDNTEIRIDAWPSSVRIKTDYGRLRDLADHRFLGGLFDPCSTSPLVHYQIKMPRSAELRIRDYKSRIDVAGIRGGTEINTYKGTVSGRQLAGRLDLETYRGEAQIDIAGWERSSRFDTYRGEIEIRLPKESRFDLSTDIGRHGTLQSSFERRRSVNGGGPLLRLKTYRGTIRLRAS